MVFAAPDVGMPLPFTFPLAYAAPGAGLCVPFRLVLPGIKLRGSA